MNSAYVIKHGGTPATTGKDILKAERASLSDETFEMLMFLRGNKHHLKSINDS
jgi:hypothetical protein